MKLHIQGGRLVDPHNQIDALQDLFLKDGVVIAVGMRPEGFYPDRVIDAKELIVCPGLIDLAVHINFDTILDELKIAAVSGITSLVCEPSAKQLLDKTDLVAALKYRATNFSITQITNIYPTVYPLGALTIGLNGEHLSEMAALMQSGCVGLSQGLAPIVNTEVLFHALQYASSFSYPVWLRLQDPWLSRNKVVAASLQATRMGLSGSLVASEIIPLQTIISLMKMIHFGGDDKNKLHVHLCRISSKLGVDLIAEAKSEGLNISCDVDTAHLHLSSNDISNFNSNMHMQPPLRNEEDRQALCLAVQNGTIDAICSNHTQITFEDNCLPFSNFETKICRLKLLLPLTLAWASNLKLSYIQALAPITSAPAKVLNLLNNKQAGQLSVGSIANICIFNPNKSQKQAEHVAIIVLKDRVIYSK